jgi:hypothetical protein
VDGTADGCVGDAAVGLIIEDSDGHYFAIAPGELVRFQIPESYVEAIKALVQGREPAGRPEVRGFREVELPEGLRLLLREPADGAGGSWRPAVRRLAAWRVLG